MKVGFLKHATSFALLGVASAALVACGGGNGGTSVTTLPTTEGAVVSSYIAKAVVTLDFNDNGICEATEPQVVSDMDGKYSFPGLGDHMVCSDGGYNTATNLPVIGQTKAPAGAAVVTPLSTLVMALAQNQTSSGQAPSAATIAAVQTQLETQLGLPSGAISQDPIAAIATTPKIEQINASVQVLLQTVASSVTAFAGVTNPNAGTTDSDVKAAMNAVFTQAVQAVATTLSTTAIDLTSASSTNTASFVQSVVATTVTNVKNDTSGAVAALQTAAGGSSSNITTLSPTNAAAFVASNVATVVQSVATTSLTGSASEIRATLAAKETTAQQNVTVTNAVTSIVTAAPDLFVGTPTSDATAIAALAQVVLPASQVVANTAVTVDTTALATSLAAAAVATGATIDTTAVSNTVAEAVSTPPAAPAPVNIAAQPAPVVEPLPSPIVITGSTTTGSN